MTTRKGKRVSLKEGDIFEFTVPDGRLGYGVIVKAGDVPFIIILASLHDQQPSVGELAGEEILLVGWSTDACVYHGRWQVVGHDYPARIDIPFPNWKVDVDGVTYVTDVDGNPIREIQSDESRLLDYQFSRAPIAYQKAFEALHGLGDWREDYTKLTPAYARQRVLLRASSRT